MSAQNTSTAAAGALPVLSVMRHCATRLDMAADKDMQGYREAASDLREARATVEGFVAALREIAGMQLSGASGPKAHAMRDLARAALAKGGVA